MKYVTAVMLLTATLTAAGQQSADLIITNANVRTLVTPNSRARAVAVRDGRIVAVGSDDAVKKLSSSATRTIKANGRLVLPGFNDAHVHLTGVGNMFSHLDIRQSPSEGILAAISRYTKVLPKGRWILGRGWTSELALPSLAELDRATPDNPVLLYSLDYSRGFANSLGLSNARVTLSNGLATGADLEKIRRAVPANHASNWAEIVETAGNYAVSCGVTSVQDVHSDDLYSVLAGLADQGKLKVRVYDCIGLGERKKAINAGIGAADGTAMVRRGCVKGTVDGEDGEVENLSREIAEADKAGLQVMVHAIGTRSNANVLSAFEKVNAANGKRDRRSRVEHAARMRVDDIRRFQRAGVLASMQPALFYSGPAAGDDYRVLLDSGVALAFGSDSSMIDIDPISGIFAAVNSGPRSLTVFEAVRAYTFGSAYAEFQEKEKGTIEAGKLADLVILSEDIFGIEPARIRNVRVLLTVVSGNVVYDSGEV